MTQTGQNIDRSDNPIRILSAGWIITKLISYRLWLSDRTFPMAPAHQSFAQIPSNVHWLLLLISIFCLISCLLKPNRWALITLMVTEVLSCLTDQNRWQPWEYFFLFMIVGYVLQKNQASLQQTWKWLLAGLYFFSGLFKISGGFVHDVWQNLILFRWLHISQFEPWLLRLGYIPGLIEMMSGIGLLFSVTRPYAAGILIFMHALILLVIGPSGLNLNLVVWPWNLVLIWFLYQLFVKDRQAGISFTFRHPYSFTVLVAWWILPWFHFSGHWDAYFSAALYKGGVPQLYICPDNPDLKKMTSAYQVGAIVSVPCDQPVSYYRWGMKELQIVPNEENRIYQTAVRDIQNKYPGQNRYFLVRHGFKMKVEELIP